MKYRLLAVAATILLFTASCSTTNSSQFLAPDYSKDNAVKNSTVTILPVEAEYFFNIFPNYVYGELKPNESHIFDYYLPFYIERNTDADVTSIFKGDSLNGSAFEMKELNLGTDEKMQIIGPKEETALNMEAIDSRFILILDQYNYQMYTIETGGGNYAGHEMHKETRLKFETKYLIWDNELQKAAAWGKVNSVKKYSVMDGDQVYRNLLDDVLQKIIQKSPFS
ncbi:MAG: hypothetical protein JJ953_06940 [Gracilimonas sp.]|uniref:hypothetical protein n=1 Tax=Gracilimonas TaxID=649462 RepID=UPI001B0D4E97|nr:hypothetical protein [Gracilimonas sp.]MBO6585824.1 hypothetical protein [Gracilimonas sp.]MBO6616821.1 hypothetical protein [Gracilimonas sp.]